MVIFPSSKIKIISKFDRRWQCLFKYYGKGRTPCQNYFDMISDFPEFTISVIESPSSTSSASLSLRGAMTSIISFP